VVNGSLSKTAVNGAAGAKTQASGLVVAVPAVLTLLFLTGLFEDLPEATLAAVVIAALGGQWADTTNHPEDRAVPAVAVLRVESGLFFANADHVRAAIEDATLADGVRAVLLDCTTMPYVDVTAARVLNRSAADLAAPRDAAPARRRDRPGPRHARRGQRPPRGTGVPPHRARGRRRGPGRPGRDARQRQPAEEESWVRPSEDRCRWR
jgi:MFS superfamily sulfate permease-like transporter